MQRQSTTIDLPPHTSLASQWRHLAAEIQDILVDAIHHPCVLKGNRRPCLLVDTAAGLLPPGVDERDMWTLHHRLRSQGIHHSIRCRRDMDRHRIHIQLTVPDDPGLSHQTAVSARITPRPHYSQPDRRTTMQVNPAFSMMADPNPRRPKRKSWFGAFIDWLFGPAEPVEHRPAAKQGLAPSNPSRQVLEPLMAEAELGRGDSWLSVFNQALTKATGEFICKYVEPLHREDAASGFSIRAVKVAFTEATRPYLEEINNVPTDLYTRIAKTRMQQAPGSQQICLNNFYGISIDADSALLDGRVIKTLVSYSGNHFWLKFVFDGDYIFLQSVIPHEPPDSQDSDGHSADDVADESCSSTKEETSLACYREPPGNKEETPLISFAPLYSPSVIAKLRVKSWDGKETSVEITEQILPYTIGREPRGHGLDLDKAGISGSAVSRQHIVLDRFDVSSRQFQIYNPGRNGTFYKARRMSERFIRACANDEWLSLGGVEGENTVQIALELP